jgi:hypothetical protein
MRCTRCALPLPHECFARWLIDHLKCVCVDAVGCHCRKPVDNDSVPIDACCGVPTVAILTVCSGTFVHEELGGRGAWSIGVQHAV